MTSNSLKRSFPLEFKQTDEQKEGCGCGCGDNAQDLQESFSQDSGVASFLKEQSNPFVNEEEDELPDEMKDQQFTSDDEEEDDDENMDEGRGAVEEVLGDLNPNYEPKTQNEDTGRGAVDDVLRSLDQGNGDGYGLSEEDDTIQNEVDQVVASVVNEEEEEEELEDEEEIDEILASVLEDNARLNEEDPCWDGYTMVGKKTGENGEQVPNCVPEEDADNYQEEGIQRDELLDTVLEDQVRELTELDYLAEKVLNGS